MQVILNSNSFSISHKLCFSSLLINIGKVILSGFSSIIFEIKVLIKVNIYEPEHLLSFNIFPNVNV